MRQMPCFGPVSRHTSCPPGAAYTVTSVPRSCAAIRRPSAETAKPKQLLSGASRFWSVSPADPSVRIGSFPTREEAQQAADKIVAGERKLSAFVTAR